VHWLARLGLCWNSQVTNICQIVPGRKFWVVFGKQMKTKFLQQILGCLILATGRGFQSTNARIVPQNL
jgi:hypothetical protein